MMDLHEQSQHRVEMHGLIIRLQVDGKEYIFVDQSFFQLVAWGVTFVWGAGMFALLLVAYLGLDKLIAQYWG